MSKANQENCFHYRERFDLSDLELVRLVPLELQEMEGHFDDCNDCQKWLADWQLIKLSTHELPQREVPAHLLAAIMNKIEPAPSPVTFKSDSILAVVGLILFLGISAFFGAESLEGTASWFLCFVIILALHAVTRLEPKRATT